MPLKNAARNLLLAFLLFSGTLLISVNAQTTTPTLQQTCVISNTITTPEQCITSAFPLMILALLVSFMVIALVYMLGEVFKFSTLKNWYKAELWEVTKTIIMVVAIISVMVIMSGVADVLAGQQAAQPGQNNALSTNLANLYAVDNNYLAQQLNNSYSGYASMLGLSMGIGAMKSFEIGTWFPVPILTPIGIIGAVESGSTAAVFKSNVLSSASDDGSYAFTNDVTTVVVVPTLLAFQVQYDLFYYIVAVGLGVLIPIGIVLRAIPMLRGIGGTIIGIGIGVALIYPSLLALVNLPISNYLPVLNTQAAQTATPTTCPPTPFSSKIVCSAWGSLTGVLTSTSVVPYCALTQGAGATSSLTASGLAGGALGAIPLTVAFGCEIGTNSVILQNFGGGFLAGLTPLFQGIYPVLNFVTDSTIISILQFILIAIDLLIGLIITEAVITLLSGKLRLGIGKFTLS